MGSTGNNLALGREMSLIFFRACSSVGVVWSIRTIPVSPGPSPPGTKKVVIPMTSPSELNSGPPELP